MYVFKKNRRTQRLKKLVFKLENTNYDTAKLKQELLDLDNDFTKLGEKVDKQSENESNNG